jgi:transcriptional regulator with XRE-family HTH domain
VATDDEGSGSEARQTAPRGGRRKLNPALGPAAARVRAELHISQEELGRRLECSQQYVSKFERGIVPMTPACVHRVAEALGVSARRVYLEARKNLPVSQPNGCTTKSAP